MSKLEFKLPDIGEGVTEGEIVSWLVAAGDKLDQDQDMVEVMTDKATVTIGAPSAGVVSEIRAQVGDTVPVGQVIVVLDAGLLNHSASPENLLPTIPTVIVTHDWHEALMFGDQMLVIESGRVLQAGTPSEVFAKPAHVEVARLAGVPVIAVRKGNTGPKCEHQRRRAGTRRWQTGAWCASSATAWPAKIVTF